jgi:hypothetical protein
MNGLIPSSLEWVSYKRMSSGPVARSLAISFLFCYVMPSAKGKATQAPLQVPLTPSSGLPASQNCEPIHFCSFSTSIPLMVFCSSVTAAQN